MENKAILVGRLGGDPEQAVDNRPLTFSLATSKKWRDKATGERREKTEWHNIVVFQERAQNFAGQYLKKGSLCYIEGMIATRKWTDKNGVDRYSTEILVSDFGHRIEKFDRAEGSGYRAGGSSPEDYGLPDRRKGDANAPIDEDRGFDTPPQGQAEPEMNFTRDLDDEISF